MPLPLPTATPDVHDDDRLWAQWSPQMRHAVSIGLLLVVAVAFYSPVLFSGKAIHGSDTVSWRANAEPLIEYQERTGEQALWTPNTFGGMPAFLINYKTKVPQADTLVNTVRSVAWPLGHVFVLLAGVYLLVFYLTRNHLSGLLSAVAFGFTTYLPIILSVGHNTKFVALAYAPYILLAFVYTLRRPSLLGGLVFAAALALGLRAKHPQITYYALMVALVWWGVTLGRAWRHDDLVPFAQSTGWLGLGTALALLMVAQPYLAIYQYKQFSVRGAEVAAGGGGGGMEWTKAMQWSQGPGELLTLAIADAFGGGGQTYWGPKSFTEGPHYIGGVVIALSGFALWRRRDWVTWGLGAAVLATVLFSLGKYAAWINGPMFAYFPFFEAFRAPETWLSISALGLAVLAGIGLHDSLQSASSDEGFWPMVYSFAAVGGITVLLLLTPDLVLDFEKPNERQRLVQAIQQQRPNLSVQNPRVQRFIRQRMEEQKTARRDALQSDATRTLLAVGAALLLLWLYRRRTLPGWAAGGLVVMVVLIDLWGVDTRYLGDDAFSDQPEVETQIPTTQVDRFIKKQVQAAGGDGHFRVFPLQAPYSGSPTSNAISSYHYQQIGGYHGAKLQRYQNYLDHILQLTKQGAPNENALDLLNTRYIIAQQQLPGTTVAYRDQQRGFMVLENPDAVPRGFLVGQTEVVEGDRDTWAQLRSESFDPSTTALLPEALDRPVTPLDSGSTAQVSLQSYEAPEMTWTIKTDAPRLFVASEIYYPAGWTAYLNGEEVPIHRVDYLLRGVHVPAGEHTLTMRFEPAADRYGTWIAGGTTALVYGGILGIVGIRVRRRWDEAALADEDDA
jgi:hypothetical protein